MVPDIVVRSRCRSLILAASLAWLLAACAHAEQPVADSAVTELQCPADTTMTCETSRVGRLRHGSFSSRGKRCSCVPRDSKVLTSPVIPGMQ